MAELYGKKNTEILFRNGKQRQQVSFTDAELSKCPFLFKSAVRAREKCPPDHDVMPMVVRLPCCNAATIGKLILYLKNRNLVLRTVHEVSELAVVAVSFEMSDLMQKLCVWEPKGHSKFSQ